MSNLYIYTKLKYTIEWECSVKCNILYHTLFGCTYTKTYIVNKRIKYKNVISWKVHLQFNVVTLGILIVSADTYDMTFPSSNFEAC